MYSVIKDQKFPVKMWVEGVPVEEQAKQQLRNIANMPFIHKHVAVLPDVHLGKGATIGSVIPTVGAIIPAAVGVDLGCVDADTEYLSPEGWKRIADYESGGLVLQCDADGNADYVLPQRYVKEPCEDFLWFKTKYGVNQMLSSDHKVLCWRITGRDRRRVQTIMVAEDLVREHDRLVIGAKVEFKTTFNYTGRNTEELGISDNSLRVQVMVQADACLSGKEKNAATLRFKKQRKIKRARELLAAAGIPFTYGESKDGSSWFRFKTPISTKTYKGWWGRCTNDQLEIITDECLFWDGNQKDQCFFTRDKASADFIQYAFSATGRRAVLREDVHYRDGKMDYRVFAYNHPMVGISGSPKTPVQHVKGGDGFKYCFTLPKGFWVMRRGGNIALTGNCGMQAMRTSLTGSDLPDSLASMRSLIEHAIPHGRTTKGRDKGSWGSVPNKVDLVWATLDERFKEICEKHPVVEKSNNRVHLGTLGTGNHFVEVCLDEEDRVWVMLHSGSRGVGNRIGSYFIEKAKKEMERWHIHLPDKDLSYLAEGSDHFDDYVQAVGWAQDFAKASRDVMMLSALDALRRTKGVPKFQVEKEAVNCHHNYISKESHFGKSVWVTRKGAVRARKDELGIIPGSMGARSFIVRGLGNAESFHSCSHGAGRVMSRTAAKAKFTVEDHCAATVGVECRKDAEVVDETPAAYKDIDLVMAAQADLVEPVHVLKQVLCVKG